MVAEEQDASRLHGEQLNESADAGAEETSRTPTAPQGVREKTIRTRVLTGRAPSIEEALSVCLAIVEDRRSPHRRTALIRLAEIGPDAQRAVRPLASLLTGADARERQDLLAVLGEVGEGARPVLEILPELAPGGEIDHLLLARLWWRAGGHAENAVSLLRPVLEEGVGNLGFRRRVLLAVGSLGPAAQELVPLLVNRLDRAAPEGAWVLETLGRVDSARAIPEAERLLGSPQPDVRAAAAFVLARRAGRYEIATPILAEAVTKASGRPFRGVLDDVGLRATSWLAELGPSAKAAVPSLVQALEAKSVELRCGAAEALYRIAGDTERTVPILVACLVDPTGRSTLPRWSPWEFCVARTAARLLGEMGPGARPAIDALARAKESASDYAVRRLSRDALRKISAD